MSLSGVGLFYALFNKKFTSGRKTYFLYTKIPYLVVV
jgi:hypothetical protein